MESSHHREGGHERMDSKMGGHERMDNTETEKEKSVVEEALLLLITD